MNSDIPLTLPWLLNKGEQKRRTSICSTCGSIFRHGKSWTYDCQECVAAEMDRENSVGFSVAKELGLNEFEVYRRYGRPEIYCSWKCIVCKFSFEEKLHGMANMTMWKAACPTCVVAPRFERLMNARRANRISEAKRLGHRLNLCTKHVSAVDDLSYKNVFVEFICKECGSEGNRTLAELKRGLTCACRSGSAGEEFISAYLKEKNIVFEQECCLINLGIPLSLRFDFYLPIMGVAIEFDGRQHFEAIEAWGGIKALEKQKENDQLKNEAAQQAGIKLHRIPYHCDDLAGELYRILGGNNVY